MSPLASFTLTAIATLAMGWFKNLNDLLMFEAVLLVGITLQTRSSSLPWITLKWSIPFILPLLIIHGVINPTYQQSSTLLGVLPLRSSGFQFGMHVSARIWLITIIGALWTTIDRDTLINQLIHWKLPLPVVVVAAQAIATLDYIARRIQTVYLAQQARGIAVGPGIFRRIRALPSVVIPVVLTTLVDAHSRTQCLDNRGLGTTNIAVPHPKSTPSTERNFVLFMLMVFLFLA